MGRHGKDGTTPGDGWWRSVARALLTFLLWCLESLAAAGDAVLSVMQRVRSRLWRIRRPLRWLISWTLAFLVFLIPVAIVNELNHMYAQDVAIVQTQTQTQNAEQGTLLSEDRFACTMSVELHGETIEATTSCNTASSFPAGTRVSVVQDPELPEYFLVVAPGQEWQERQAFETWMGVATGAVFGLLVLWICYWVLLLVDRPAVAKPRRPTTLADGTQGRARREGPRSQVDRVELWWESRKVALVHWWAEFIETDVRVRGAIMSACVIALSLGFLALNLSMDEQLGRDRQMAISATPVQVTLLEYGQDGTNPTVRHGTEMVALAYPLRDPGSHELGETIAVAVDPLDPARLIPIEIVVEPGTLDGLLDALPMVLSWLVVVGVLGAALIPNELVAVWQVIVDSIRRDRPETA